MTATDAKAPTVLHVVVGHGLPGYFMNAVRSVRAVAPGDPLLIIDNASPSQELRDRLSAFAAADEMVSLVLRTANDLSANRKVGSLYDAYEIAVSHAVAGGFDLLHLIQADFQVLWWDAELAARSMQIFEAHPRCVNIQMQFLSRDKILAEELAPVGGGGQPGQPRYKLERYGLTDTGLYHLGRWQAGGMRFGPSEQAHARRYLEQGLEVLIHPWPTDAAIPWPAVIRNGAQRGREISAGRPYLLKPSSPEQVAQVKAADQQTWLEDAAIPWGWACATPMWITGVDSIDYWVLRYRDARKNGLTHMLPRLDLRGIEPGDRRGLRLWPYRPSVVALFVAGPLRAVARRLRRRGTRPRSASSRR
jgi:hypothetical protein